jgi:hypothetical protein
VKIGHTSLSKSVDVAPPREIMEGIGESSCLSSSPLPVEVAERMLRVLTANGARATSRTRPFAREMPLNRRAGGTVGMGEGGGPSPIFASCVSGSAFVAIDEDVVDPQGEHVVERFGVDAPAVSGASTESV